jgi:AcrR family transcriptional regulator
MMRMDTGFWGLDITEFLRKYIKRSFKTLVQINRRPRTRMKARPRILTPSPSGSGRDASRRERILEAAEQVFGEAGFAGASLRAIVRQAHVNLATVYYYFGSKNGLMEAVLKRRFGPLRQQQLDSLREMERKARGRPLPVESILKAMLMPPLTLVTGGPEPLGAVARLVGRIVTEPDEQSQAVIRSSNAEVREAFLKAFQQSLPGVSPAQLQWRLEFVRGALALILCDPHKLEQESRGACNPIDAEKVLAEMLLFFASGFRATSRRKNHSS